VFPIAALLLIGVAIFLSGKWNAPKVENDFRKQRLLVLPFQNRTGDTSLAYIGEAASFGISLYLDQTEAELVSYLASIQNNTADRMGFSWKQNLSNFADPINLIEGHYTKTTNNNIEFQCALIDGQTSKIITGFPLAIAPANNFNQAITALAKRIVGLWISDSNIFDRTLAKEDALRALVEGLRHWYVDYETAIQFIEKSILLDSTFAEAHLYLFDAHYNTKEYSLAESALTRLRSSVGFENLTGESRDRFLYNEALLHGQPEIKYQYAKKLYLDDPTSLEYNTSFAIIALEHANEPKEALQVLETISWDSLNFLNLPFLQDRISIGIKSAMLLDEFEKAKSLSRYYPNFLDDPEFLRLASKPLVALEDTASINDILHQVALTKSKQHLVEIYHDIAEEFLLRNRKTLADHYLKQGLLSTAKTIVTPAYFEILQNCGQAQKTVQYLEDNFSNNLNHPMVRFMLGRGYAKLGNHSKVREIIENIDDDNPPWDFGESAYQQGVLYTLMGDYKSALVLLEEAVKGGLVFTSINMDFDPDLMPLFEMPKYQAITHPLR
ncbi:MAG: hypothetical protein KTR24_12110, partial [Saprospiraceae bacterium]|nr:hypothetical protein [Saprospiraceae bacterium]